MIDHVGIYGSRVAEGLSAFNVGLVVNEKFYILIKISLKFVPEGPIDNDTAFGLDNGLAPNRWQAIIWTNADPIYWRICGALGEMS